jgi:hypothetical protein
LEEGFIFLEGRKEGRKEGRRKKEKKSVNSELTWIVCCDPKISDQET